MLLFKQKSKTKKAQSSGCSCGYTPYSPEDYSRHMTTGEHNVFMTDNMVPEVLAGSSVFDNPDFGHRNCSGCGKKFTSISQYREHHYLTRCGGY